jgi:hypothetical protein
MAEQKSGPKKREGSIRIQYTPTPYHLKKIQRKVHEFNTPRIGAATIVSLVMIRAINGTLVDKKTGKGFFDDDEVA